MKNGKGKHVHKNILKKLLNRRTEKSINKTLKKRGT
jgi:hypothetical protein